MLYGFIILFIRTSNLRCTGSHASGLTSMELAFIFAAVGKKLSAAGKVKGCEAINLWAKGIKNHLYYSVLTSDGKSVTVMIFIDAQIN